MAYRVVNNFKDKNTGEHYKKDNFYPKTGQPTKSRIDELTEIHPIHKRVFIEKVQEKQEEELKNEETEGQAESKTNAKETKENKSSSKK